MSEYIVWEGAGWYANRSNPKGDRAVLVGRGNNSDGHRAAIDKARQYAAGSPKWHDKPPAGVKALSLEQFRELVIARKL